MQKTTLFYQLKKMMGISQSKKVNKIILTGLCESFEPSENSIKNIMAFSNAYRCDKSDAIGHVEYLIN